MRVIVPVAGSGKRFAQAGYKDPKPLIAVKGRQMIEWALDPLPPEWLVCAVAQPHWAAHYQDKMPSYVHVHPLLGPTEGAACTVLSVALSMPPDEPVAVMNADQTFTVNLTWLQTQALAEQWDGYILTFKTSGVRWSYVQQHDGWVTRVAEKQEISHDATVGFYWFRKARDLVIACSRSIVEGTRTNGEFYLAPVYNHLINYQGAQIRAVPVTEFHGLGTPEDVEAFERA